MAQELHLYSYLAEHGLPEGRFRVAQIYVRDLARAMRVSVRTVQRWLRKLEACGLIRTEPTFFDHGGHAANRYLLHGTGLEEEALPENDSRGAGAGGDTVALRESDLGRVAPSSGEQVEGAESSEKSQKGPPPAEKEPPQRVPQRGEASRASGSPCSTEKEPPERVLQRGGTVESEERRERAPLPESAPEAEPDPEPPWTVPEELADRRFSFWEVEGFFGEWFREAWIDLSYEEERELEAALASLKREWLTLREWSKRFYLALRRLRS